MSLLESHLGRRILVSSAVIALVGAVVFAVLLGDPSRAGLPGIVAAGLGALLVGLAGGALLARRALGPIVEATALAERLAGGELPEHGRISSFGDADELGRLAGALDSLTTRLRAISGDVLGERNALSAVLTNMDDGIIIFSADGRVTLANPAVERILQLPTGRTLGATLIEALRDHELAEYVRSCLAAKTSFDLTRSTDPARSAGRSARLLEAGLPRRYLRVQATRLADSRGLVVLQDLTEVRRADTIRRDFVANVSHELRTPLASLKALVETLQDGALEDPPAAHAFLGRMNVEVDGLTQLVRELLELSRIEAGRVALRVERVEVDQVLRQAADRLQAQADRADVALTVDVQPDLPEIPLDADKVQQALINLIHNAIKFTPAGGRIVLIGQGARLKLDGGFELLAGAAGPVPTHVVLTVADTGIGIAADDLPRIFERFYKADKARSGGGTGLGLAIVKHIAEAHGGRVWVESIEGQGATFRIAIPATHGGPA